MKTDVELLTEAGKIAMTRAVVADVMARVLGKSEFYLTADPSRRGEPARCFVMRVTAGTIQAGWFASQVIGFGETWLEALEVALGQLALEGADMQARLKAVRVELGAEVTANG